MKAVVTHLGAPYWESPSAKSSLPFSLSSRISQMRSEAFLALALGYQLRGGAQYSSANMIVITRSVTEVSDGSGE